MKSTLKQWFVILMFTITTISLAACNDSGNVSADPSDSSSDNELQTVNLALSPFQDVYSIHVGIEKGFFEEEGIEINIQETDWAGGNDLLVGGRVELATAG